MLCSTVLNAFRHHSGSHNYHPKLRGNPVRVLNAFRHHSGSHPSRGLGRIFFRSVLNAFRHHSGSHLMLNLRLLRMLVGWMCSTPFGITAVLTRINVLSGVDTFEAVLNAFRHHSGSHARRCGLPASARTPGVLNAFRHHSGSHPHNAVAPLAYCQFPVLNAFRHHSGSHPSRGLGRIFFRSVLNAFRHHSGSHWCHRDCAIHECWSSCSTPFGITAVLTSGSRISVSGWGHCAQRLSASQRFSRDKTVNYTPCAQLVLNAFRHHSGSHLALYERLRIPGILCSTPFGITAVLTCRQAISRRPSNTVCSTPFGITAVLTCPSCGTLEGESGCAQRLSASQRFSPQVQPIRPIPCFGVCSTPFGITAVLTSPA